MAESQQKFSEALKSVKGTLAAPDSNFHDLAGDSLGKLRRGLLTCESHAPKAFVDVHNSDKLDVIDFLVKCSAKKSRKSQVVECLGILIIKEPWARAINSSYAVRSSIESVLEGNQVLLHALSCPISASVTTAANSSEKVKILSVEDFESTTRYLKSGREAMAAAGWDYNGHSDEAISGFRCLYNAVVKIDSAHGTRAADSVFVEFQKDWRNLVIFLKSLHNARKSLRSQVTFVVDKLSTQSDSFCGILQETSALPWQSSSNPQSPNASDDDVNPIVADTHPPILNTATSVLIRIGSCQRIHTGVKVTNNNGVEVHLFHDDPSRSNAIHIDVLAHIMELFLDHQGAKQVVSVQIDRAQGYPHLCHDIQNFFQIRGLATPHCIAM